MVAQSMKVVLRYVENMSGEQYVMISGRTLMPVFCAGSLDILMKVSDIIIGHINIISHPFRVSNA